MPRHRSSLTPLALAYAALVVYASLYPFTGWEVPGVSPWAFLGLPWPQWWTGFDLVANLLGYLPLGALVFGALVRSGGGVRASMILAVLIGSTLSFTMEFTQNYLPRRVASNVDLALNAAGSAGGAVLGALLHGMGAVERWQRLRERWFVDQSAGALALIVLWPAGLLFPTALPLGLGQVLPRLREWAISALDGAPWASGAVALLEAAPPGAGGLSRLAEFCTVALGLLAPCLVAFSVSRPGWRRALLVLGALALAGGATTLSTTLNFGPQHALAWRTPVANDALLIGVAPRLVAVLGAVTRGGRARADGAGGAGGRWSPRHRPTPTSPKACWPGSRADSSASMACRSGSAGCGPTRPWPT